MKTTDTVGRTHHKRSISKLNYFAACPAFEGLPFVRTPNNPADQGTMQHSYMELAVEYALQEKKTVRESLDWALANLPDDKKIVDWDEDFLGNLQFCADYADKYFSNPAFTGAVQEIKVSLLPKADTAGHFDVLVFFGKKIALLFDWKFGRIAVPAAFHNYQGKGYAAGVMLKYPELERVGVVFVQPRLFSASEAIFTRGQLPTILAEIHDILFRAAAPNPQPVFNSYCSYCAKQATCPAVVGHLSKAVTQFRGLPAPPSFNGSELSKPEDIALLRLWVDWLENVTDSVKQKALDAAIANGGSIECRVGDEIYRYEVQERASARSIRSPNLVSKALEEVLTPEEVLGAAKLSVTGLETIFAEQAVAQGKAESIKAAKEGMTALLEAEGLLSRPDFRVRFLKAKREKVTKSISDTNKK